jgi:glycosyltransferase involved in cell wall biosynthesis
MRILFTTPFVPYPPIEGGRTIPYRYLEGLAARGHELTVLLPLRRPEDPGNLPEIERFGAVHPVAVPNRPAWRIALDALRSGESLRVRRHAFHAVERRFAELLREVEPELVCLESLFTAYLAPVARRVSPRVPVVVLEQNVESRLFRRLVGTRRGPWRLLGAWESARVERAERRAVAGTDAVVTLSEEDARALRDLVPGARTIVRTPGIGTHEGETIPPPSDRRTVLFLGSYGWPPNRDGVRWLLDEIWPRVRRARPEARLVLAGNDPRNEMPALADPDRGVVPVGFVDDVSRTMREAAVSVVPIRFGSGVRLKILEALANERPVVTTTPGLEGLPLLDGEHVVVADEAEAFAAEVARLLDDAETAGRLAAAGRERVEAEFSWSAVTRSLSRSLEELIHGD